MVTAPAADQRRLLDVQALDITLQQLAHRRKTLPESARLADLEAQLADLSKSLVTSRTAASDLRRELAKAEGDVEQVRARASRDQARLDSGQVGAKDAQALLSELETLKRRQGALEEVQLGVMERLEAHEEALHGVERAHTELTIARDTARAQRDGKLAEIDDEIALVSGHRKKAIEGLDAGLLKLYERVRDQNGGRGVVSMRGKNVEGLSMPLSPAELSAVISADPQQVVRLEDSGYIVVRLDD